MPTPRCRHALRMLLAAPTLAMLAATAAHAATPPSTLTMTVRSDLFAGRGAVARIGVDGRQVASLATSGRWRTVTLSLGRAVKPTDDIEVFFANDRFGLVNGHMQDRNLYVKDIRVDDRAVAPASTRVDAGATWAAATDGKEVSPGSQEIASAGALRFPAGPVVTAAAAPSTASPSSRPTTSAPAVTSSPSATGTVTRPASIAGIQVSPTGSGSGCTLAQPCSLDTGLALVRSTVPKATADVTLVLHGGTYARTSPITLGPADSGANGHRVVWTAAPGEKPVIDGGRRITGWTPWSGRAGVYRAPVPVGTASRQLYVDGVLAERASAPAAQVFGAMAKDPSGAGYSITRSDAASWKNLRDAEVVWSGGKGANVAWEDWVERRCPIAGVDAGLLSLVKPCFATADPAAIQGVGIPTTVENSLALLTRPGQFYVDGAEGWLYYMPRTTENLTTSHVVLPVAQGLVRATGVHDLTLRGVSFSYDTWLGPSSDDGFIDVQAAVHSVQGQLVSPPGALRFLGSRGVLLDGVSVTGAGGSGVEFAGGSSSSTIQNSSIAHVAGTGIVLGGEDARQTGDTGLAVLHDEVQDTGTQYHGAVGILGGFVSSTAVLHNRVHNTSYTGISVGWGWGEASSQGSNRIEGNRVTDVMQSPLTDGAAIYVNGSSRGASSISGNYLDNHGRGFGVIYLDGAAQGWSVSSNVVARTGSEWLSVQDVGHVSTGNTITGNETDATTAHYGVPGDNVIQANRVGVKTWSPAAQAVINAAG